MPCPGSEGHVQCAQASLQSTQWKGIGEPVLCGKPRGVLEGACPSGATVCHSCEHHPLTSRACQFPEGCDLGANSLHPSQKLRSPCLVVRKFLQLDSGPFCLDMPQA